MQGDVVMDGIAVPQVEVTAKPEKPAGKRRIGLIVAIVVAVVAIGAFAYAIVWSGGLDQVTALVGPYLGLTSAEPQTAAKAPAASAQSQAAGQQPSKTSELAAVAMPAWAASTMYEEQLTSQVGISAMIENEVDNFAFSAPVDAENGVQVPFKATLSDGTTRSGTISLLSVDGGWFFAGLDTGVTKEVPDTQIDESIVNVITKQQATPSSQEALKAFSDGSVTGMDVLSATQGSGTASVNVLLRGGTYEGKSGRFVMVKKVDGLDDYWFVTGFNWK